MILKSTEQEIQIYFPARRRSSPKINPCSTIRPTVDYPVCSPACCPPQACITSCIPITIITRFYGRARALGCFTQVRNATVCDRNVLVDNA